MRTNGAVNWSKAKRILEPDITGKKWQELITAGTIQSAIVASPVDGHPFARQITIQELGKNPWDLQIAHSLDVSFRQGSHVRLTYWARSSESCKLAAVVEQATDPYTKIASREVTLSPKWQRYSEEWDPKADTKSAPPMV